jgi:hypothetical protein
MGAASDSSAVVDPTHFGVHGVEGLRVVSQGDRASKACQCYSITGAALSHSTGRTQSTTNVVNNWQDSKHTAGFELL